MTEKSRVAIVGVLPPPFGGVSVHVKRYMELLENSSTIDAWIYEQTGKDDPQNRVIPFSNSPIRFVKFLMSFKEDLVHFHFNNYRALSIAGQFLPRRKNKRYIITLHSEKVVRWFDELNWVYRKLVADCLRKADHLICVNEPIRDFMESGLGIAASRLSVIPAFLPPTEEEKSEHHIPDELLEFVASKEKVVGTHGWFGYFVNGAHVYSFDHVARLAQEIADRDSNIGMYTVISGNYEESHRQEILAMQRELSHVWKIVETPFSCASLYAKTDLFVRPTVTDGDSVSIRECLSLGVPVLASDAVPRPEGCSLYPSRDYESLSKTFWNELLDPTPPKVCAGRFERQLIELIESLLR